MEAGFRPCGLLGSWLAAAQRSLSVLCHMNLFNRAVYVGKVGNEQKGEERDRDRDREKEKERKRRSRGLCNLVMEGLSHHSAVVLMVTSKLPGAAPTGRGLRRACIRGIGEWGSLSPFWILPAPDKSICRHLCTCSLVTQFPSIKTLYLNDHIQK